jgi:eukaryotic-like serine/threonine-protein kinase
MGKVSVARDEPLGREVALKEILDSAGSSPDILRRFLEEAAITARLEHPGVVPIYALGTNRHGRPFYVMRLVRGRPLKGAIEAYHSEPTPAGLRELLRRFGGGRRRWPARKWRPGAGVITLKERETEG